MSTYIGRTAENMALQKLELLGFNLVAQNWRTRLCEVDIIVSKGDTIYFVEVKYRRSSVSGDGIDYITSKKLQQMRFAAELWCAQNRWLGDYELAAIAVSGSDYTVGDLVLCG